MNNEPQENGSAVTVARAQGDRPAAAHDAGSAIYAYSDVMKENLPVEEDITASIWWKLSTATNQLCQAIGSHPVTLVPMPVLFAFKTDNERSGHSAATVNTVNGLLSADGTYCYLEPGCSAFSEYVGSVFPKTLQITGAWWGLHCQNGEVHCATTARRSLDLSTPWWDKLEQWE